MDMAMQQVLEKLNNLEKQINKRFDKQEEVNDQFALKFLEHDKKFDNLVDLIKKNHNEVLNSQDKIKKKVDRLDVERISANENIKRLDVEVRKLGGFAS